LILIDVGNKKPMISVIPKFNKIIGRVPTTKIHYTLAQIQLQIGEQKYNTDIKPSSA
jgi:hypothetical protein